MSAYKWAILLLVIFSLLASACTVTSAQSQGGVVKIISPQQNGNAGPTERVSGKAQLSKGYSLWIVPYDPTAGKYYPEALPVTVKSAAWSSRLSVGTIFRVGKTFQIHAVVADQSAGTALSSYAAQRTGITKLPPGAQAVDAVTVKRVAADVAGAPSASPSPSAVPRTASTAGSNTTAGRVILRQTSLKRVQLQVAKTRFPVLRRCTHLALLLPSFCYYASPVAAKVL